MLARWYPFQGAEHWLKAWDPAQAMQAMERMFQHWDAWLQGVGRGYPPLELTSTPQELVLKAEVPGVSPEDLQVQVTETEVHLRGTLRGAGGDGECLYSERRTGTFHRMISLPCPVDPQRVRARYHSGVLEVRMPKKEPGTQTGRQVPIELQ